jgi:hypothetical protein
MNIEITARGPIFDGRAEIALKDFVADSQQHVAQKGAALVRNNLHSVLRHPTGYYESNVHAEGNIIDDGGVIYGPWLEGVGSRNSPVTRFPGYFTFRRTTQQLQRLSVVWSNEFLRTRYLRRMQ